MLTDTASQPIGMAADVVGPGATLDDKVVRAAFADDEILRPVIAGVTVYVVYVVLPVQDMSQGLLGY